MNKSRLLVENFCAEIFDCVQPRFENRELAWLA
jgi:hypothetical protein